MSINFPFVLFIYFWLLYFVFLMILIVSKIILMLKVDDIKDWRFENIIVYNIYYVVFRKNTINYISSS